MNMDVSKCWRGGVALAQIGLRQSRQEVCDTLFRSDGPGWSAARTSVGPGSTRNLGERA